MQEYSLMQLKKTNGKYFYVKFKNLETGLYGTAISVESLRKKLGDIEQHHITKKVEATSIVFRAIEQGLDGNRRKEDPYLAEYLVSFWDYETSSYVKKENRKRKNSINRDHCKNMQKLLIRHVIQDVAVISKYQKTKYSEKGNKYGKDRLIDSKSEKALKLPLKLKASQLKTYHLSNIQKLIFDVRGLSVKTWLLVQSAIRVPVQELMRQDIIIKDPFLKLEKYSVSQIETTRGCLSREESSRLVLQVYSDIKEKKINERIGYGIILGSATGLREGEIRALNAEAIEIPDVGNLAIIHVVRAYAREAGFKSTKTKSQRNVAIAKEFALLLLEQAEKNPNKDGLVFWSDVNKGLPLTECAFERNFNKELAKSGISDEERRARNISFYSQRHYANTEGISRIGVELTNQFIGHITMEMAKRYDHPDSQRAIAIGEKLGSLIPEFWKLDSK